MNSHLQKILAQGCLLLALSLAQPAQAAPSACPGATVTTTAVNFGNYDPTVFPPTAVTSTGTITVTCGGKAQVDPIISIQLSAGDSGVFSQRFMLDTTTGVNTLNYNLFIDATYAATSIWGDGTGGTQDPGGSSSGVSGTNTLVVTVFGQIPAGQDPYAGCTVTGCSYSDTINITVNF